MSTSDRPSTPRPGYYIIEAAAGIAFCYFVLGGSQWSPAAWAFFSVAASGLVAVQVMSDQEKQTALENRLWKFRFGLVVVTSLLGGALWQRSLLLAAFGVVLGGLWLRDLRSYREHARERSAS